jgi:hypothetical protein
LPPVSASQRRFFRWADEHPEESGVSRKVSEEFNSSDPGGKLPEHVSKRADGGGIGSDTSPGIGGDPQSAAAARLLGELQAMSPDQLRAAATGSAAQSQMARHVLSDKMGTGAFGSTQPPIAGPAQHYARGGGMGLGIHGGMHMAGNIIPRGHLVPGFSGGDFKPPKPEGVSPSGWAERSEARGMDRPMAGGNFASGGGIGADPTRLQMGGEGETSPWFERQEARNEIDMPHGGFLNSSIAGRTDRLPLAVAADSHVLPADVVSGLGQGNSLSGQRVMQEALKTGPYGDPHPQVTHGRGPPRAPGIPGEVEHEMFGYAHGGRTPDQGVSHTLMAGGELVLAPHDWTDGKYWYRGVKSIGGGDIDKGHKILRELTHRVRQHTMEFLKHAPTPKK